MGGFKFKELSSLVNLCNEFGCSEGVKQFSKLRSRALGRSFCDFTYECQQAIDSYPNCPKELVAELNKIMTT